MLHVVGKCFDLLRAGGKRGGSLLQTPRELEPPDGKSIETGIVDSLAFDFVESHGLSRPADPSNRPCNQ